MSPARLERTLPDYCLRAISPARRVSQFELMCARLLGVNSRAEHGTNATKVAVTQRRSRFRVIEWLAATAPYRRFLRGALYSDRRTLGLLRIFEKTFARFELDRIDAARELFRENGILLDTWTSVR